MQQAQQSAPPVTAVAEKRINECMHMLTRRSDIRAKLRELLTKDKFHVTELNFLYGEKLNSPKGGELHLHLVLEPFDPKVVKVGALIKLTDN